MDDELREIAAGLGEDLHANAALTLTAAIEETVAEMDDPEEIEAVRAVEPGVRALALAKLAELSVKSSEGWLDVNKAVIGRE